MATDIGRLDFRTATRSAPQGIWVKPDPVQVRIRYPYQYWFDIGVRTCLISTPQRHRLVTRWRPCCRVQDSLDTVPRAILFPHRYQLRSCTPPTPGNPCCTTSIPLLIESS